MNYKVILLADDDSDDTEMFCEALEIIDTSIVFHCAVNGSEALKKLDGLEDKPQLIFLDLNMPVMNGWQCLKLLKENEHYKNIPVIMISTSSHQKEMDMAAKMGAFCYFVKPSDFNELTQLLRVVVSNPETGLQEAVQNLQTGGSQYIYFCSDNDSKL
ncbi:response regulator [Emticicia sp. C21]|uniref:response regulator n=1 Tax=Emticicia sp. C21 TaxID=2302915 RepID=UPI000E3516CD|nr:response regulator [Emticicia sp. C21]RFS16774.1 response regulator [Emticicia sp. C21]